MGAYLSHSLNRTCSLNSITSQVSCFWIFPRLLQNSIQFSLSSLRMQKFPAFLPLVNHLQKFHTLHSLGIHVFLEHSRLSYAYVQLHTSIYVHQQSTQRTFRTKPANILRSWSSFLKYTP